MAQQHFQIAPIIRSTETVVRDGDEEIARFTATEMTLRHPDGKIEHSRLHENLILSDGTSFNAAMMFAQPPVQIGVCRLCRRPPYTFPVRDRPTHGLVRLTRAKTCAHRHCGSLCCPKHRTRCSDGQYRCTRCARTWFWWELILGIFCSKG